MAVNLVSGSGHRPDHETDEPTSAHKQDRTSSSQRETEHSDAGSRADAKAPPGRPPAHTPLQQQMYARLAIANGKSPSKAPSVPSAQLPKVIDSLGGKFTPQKLDTLTSALQGQPPDVIAKTLNNPTVQQLLKGAATWISEGDTQPGHSAKDSAVEASSRLASAVKGLPSTYAAQIIKESLPAIEKMTLVPGPPGREPLMLSVPAQDTEANPAAETFKNISEALGSLDNSPESQGLVNQVAQAYTKDLMSSPWTPSKTNGLQIQEAIKQGASPRLALALASDLASAGQRAGHQLSGLADGAAAQTVLNAALHNTDAGRIKALQSDLTQEVDKYNKLLPDLKWALGATQGVLTPAQLQKAINNYKPMESVLAKMKADVQALNSSIAQVSRLEKQYPALKGLLAGALGKVGQDKTVQSAEALMAQKDPKIFKGGPESDGAEAFAFWSDEASRSHDLTNALASAYLTNDVLPAFDALRKGEDSQPAIAQAQAALNDIQSKSKLLGISPGDAKAAVHDLDEVLDSYKDGGQLSATDKHSLQEGLTALKHLPFSSGPAGLIFRALGFALAASATYGAYKDAKGAHGAEKLQDELNFVSQAAGLTSQTAQAATSPGAIRAAEQVGIHIDPDGFISVVGEGAERAAGGLDAATFFVGALRGLASGDYTDAALNTAGVVGAILGLAGDDTGIGLIIEAGVAIHNHDQNVKYSGIAKTFLEGALGSKTAQTLSTNEARDAELLRQQLGLSPKEVQDLATHHPELFSSHEELTQAFIAAAKGCGVKGSNTLPFANALAKDEPGEYVNQLGSWYSTMTNTRPAAQQAELFHALSRSGKFPNTMSFLRTNLPQELRAAANARRLADEEYNRALQSPNSSTYGSILNLLKGNSDPAFQVEIIRQMQQGNSLASWVQHIRNDGDSGSTQIARTAITAAEDAHVLSKADANRYLDELG